MQSVKTEGPCQGLSGWNRNWPLTVLYCKVLSRLNFYFLMCMPPWHDLLDTGSLLYGHVMQNIMEESVSLQVFIICTLHLLQGG